MPGQVKALRRVRMTSCDVFAHLGAGGRRSSDTAGPNRLCGRSAAFE